MKEASKEWRKETTPDEGDHRRPRATIHNLRHLTSPAVHSVSSVVYDVSDSRNEPRKPAPLTSSLDGLHYDRDNRPSHSYLVPLGRRRYERRIQVMEEVDNRTRMLTIPT